MRTLAKGSLNAEDVAQARRSMDAAREKGTTARPAPRGTDLENTAKGEQQADESDLDTDDEDRILAETWAQNKDFKRSMRTDRQRGLRQGRKSKLTIEQLKLITKCGRCGQRGHWHRACEDPEKPRDDITGFSFPTGGSEQAYLDVAAGSSTRPRFQASRGGSTSQKKGTRR